MQPRKWLSGDRTWSEYTGDSVFSTSPVYPPLVGILGNIFCKINLASTGRISRGGGWSSSDCLPSS